MSSFDLIHDYIDNKFLYAVESGKISPDSFAVSEEEIDIFASMLYNETNDVQQMF